MSGSMGNPMQMMAERPTSFVTVAKKNGHGKKKRDKRTSCKPVMNKGRHDEAYFRNVSRPHLYQEVENLSKVNRSQCERTSDDANIYKKKFVSLHK